MKRTRERHGRCYTKEYVAWKAMLTRCYNTKSTGFKHWGGRGISVCSAWRNSFREFLKDVGLAPSSAHTLDRRENNGDYEPGNVRWVTRRIQCRNKTSNRFLTYKGLRLTIAEWGERTGFGESLIRHRLGAGKSLNEAIEMKPSPPGRRFIRAFGVSHHLLEWGRLTGFCVKTIGERLRRGWSPENALTIPRAWYHAE